MLDAFAHHSHCDRSVLGCTLWFSVNGVSVDLTAHGILRHRTLDY